MRNINQVVEVAKSDLVKFNTPPNKIQWLKLSLTILLSRQLKG